MIFAVELRADYVVNPGETSGGHTIVWSASVPPGALPAPAVSDLGRFALFAGIVLAAGLVGLGVRRRRIA